MCCIKFQQIAELKASLEKEQKKGKDLAAQTVKLNGIIKTGHDALTQEQALVKKLQQQLESSQKVCGGISTDNVAYQNRHRAVTLEQQQLLSSQKVCGGISTDIVAYQTQAWRMVRNYYRF